MATGRVLGSNTVMRQRWVLAVIVGLVATVGVVALGGRLFSLQSCSPAPCGVSAAGDVFVSGATATPSVVANQESAGGSLGSIVSLDVNFNADNAKLIVSPQSDITLIDGSGVVIKAAPGLLPGGLCPDNPAQTIVPPDDSGLLHLCFALPPGGRGPFAVTWQPHSDLTARSVTIPLSVKAL